LSDLLTTITERLGSGHIAHCTPDRTIVSVTLILFSMRDIPQATHSTITIHTAIITFFSHFSARLSDTHPNGKVDGETMPIAGVTYC
jgi:hypothetical protein